MTGPWLVQVLGDEPEYFDGESYEDVEISVVHRDNQHGQASWGWAEHEKLIFITYHEVDERELTRLKGCAQAVADHLNAQEA